jgi:hypothetical protein
MEDSWCVGDPEEAASRLRFSCFSAFVLPGSPLPRDALTLPENLEPVPKPVPQQWVPLAAGPVDRASRVLVERFTASDATHGCQSFDQLLIDDRSSQCPKWPLGVTSSMTDRPKFP